MPTHYRTYQPEQSYLLAPSVRDWLPEGHLSLFISDVVDELDLRGFYRRFEESDARGNAPYHPGMMVKILIYAYATGTFSSRKIAKKIEEDIAYRVLAAGNFPQHRTICEFRKNFLSEFIGVFKQVVQIAKASGMIGLGRVAIDGTKIKANASRHKAMSYDRMKKEERRLKQEIEELLKRADQVDKAEDAEFGEEVRGDELPEELRRRETRLQKIREAKTRLEQRQEDKDRQEGRHVDEEGKTRARNGQAVKRKFGEPPEKAQDNFTDPESRIMKAGNGFEQCYNAQAAVDEKEQFVIAADVTNCAADNEQLHPMINATHTNLDATAEQFLADAGYRSEENLKKAEIDHINLLVAIGREGQTELTISEDKQATLRMKAKLSTEQGASDYGRRKAIVEPVFGWIKHATGFRQFSFRGVEKVKAEWHLVCLALNLKRMSSRVAASGI